MFVSLSILFCYQSQSVFGHKDGFGLAAKQKLVMSAKKKLLNKTFEIVEKGQCHQFGGWRWLFVENGLIPVKSSVDGNFSWLYSDKIVRATKSDCQIEAQDYSTGYYLKVICPSFSKLLYN